MSLSLGGLPEADIQKMLAGNALEVYDVDKEALWALAARIGPLKQSLSQRAA